MKQLTILLHYDEEPKPVILSLQEIGRHYPGQYGLSQHHQAIEFVHEDPEAVDQACDALNRTSLEGSMYTAVLPA